MSRIQSRYARRGPRWLACLLLVVGLVGISGCASNGDGARSNGLFGGWFKAKEPEPLTASEWIGQPRPEF